MSTFCLFLAFLRLSRSVTRQNVFFFEQVEEIELVDRKGYLTVSMSIPKEGKILLRKPEGIREWFQDIKVRERE